MRGRKDPRPRVALVVDHPQRDLPGLVLTAFALCQRGIVCHLVPLNLQDRELPALAPDLVLLNYLRPGNEAVTRALLAAGVRIGLLDTEGAVWSECGAYTELLWRDTGLLRQVRPACMWGPRMGDCVTGAALLDPSQVVITGCPRFDLYHPDWRSVLSESAPGTTPRILINTNFSGINPRFATVEQNRRQFADGFGWSDDRVAWHLETERQGIEGMIALARSLACDVGSAEVRVRPHPFEDVGFYERRLAGIPRIRVTNDRPIHAELFEATVVIQRSCSTAIESAMAGVPTLSPRWIPTPAEIPMAEAVSAPCGTYEELRDCVVHALNGGLVESDQVRASKAAVVQDYFHRLDGCAHSRVADAVSTALTKNAVISLDECLDALYRVKHSSHSLPSAAAARVRRALRLSPYWSFRAGRSVPPSSWTSGAKAFTTEEVGRLAHLVARAAAKSGRDTRPVVASSAGAVDEYVCRFEGYSQTLAVRAATSAGGRDAGPAAA